MKNKFQIIDESGDHKYFTIIPNYIVNHSTVYEQAIYLYMKRIAGESGTCWSSAQQIAIKLGISRNTVKKYIENLIERKWLEVIGIRLSGPSKQPHREYRIIDLWKFNTGFYQSKKVSTVDKVSIVDKRCQPMTPEVSTIEHKEEPIKEEPINKRERQNPAPKEFFANEDIQEKFKNMMIEKGVPAELARREMDKFVLYWTEPSKSGLKVRWEAQGFFDIKRRLVTWFGKVDEYSKKGRIGVAL